MLAMKPITISLMTNGSCGGGTNVPWGPMSSGGGASAMGAGIGTGNAGCNTGGGNNGGGGSCGCGGGGSGAPGSGGPPRGGSGGERGILSSGGGGLFATSVGVVTDRYCLAGSTGSLPAANSDTCYSPGSGHSGTNICIGPNFPIRF